jgi:hypothetical protein
MDIDKETLTDCIERMKDVKVEITQLGLCFRGYTGEAPNIVSLLFDIESLTETAATRMEHCLGDE